MKDEYLNVMMEKMGRLYSDNNFIHEAYFGAELDDEVHTPSFMNGSSRKQLKYSIRLLHNLDQDWMFIRLYTYERGDSHCVMRIDEEENYKNAEPGYTTLLYIDMTVPFSDEAHWFQEEVKHDGVVPFREYVSVLHYLVKEAKKVRARLIAQDFANLDNIHQGYANYLIPYAY